MAVDELHRRQNNADRMDVAGRFAKNLVRYRKSAGLSQEELGMRADLHRTQVGRLERGERLPRIDTLAKLAGSLSLPPADLLEGIEWKPESDTAGGFSIVEGDGSS